MRAIVALSMIALSGCASTGTAPARPDSQQTVRVVGAGGAVQFSASHPTLSARAATIPMPVEQVWRAMPAVYESLGIPVGRLDAESRVVGNPGIKLRRRLGSVPLTRYLNCGSTQGGPSAETYEVHLSMLTQAQPGAPGSTTVATTVEATARPVTLAGESVRCASTGALEARVVEVLTARLAS